MLTRRGLRRHAFMILQGKTHRLRRRSAFSMRDVKILQYGSFYQYFKEKVGSSLSRYLSLFPRILPSSFLFHETPPHVRLPSYNVWNPCLSTLVSCNPSGTVGTLSKPRTSRKNRSASDADDEDAETRSRNMQQDDLDKLEDHRHLRESR